MILQCKSRGRGVTYWDDLRPESDDVMNSQKLLVVFLTALIVMAFCMSIYAVYYCQYLGVC